MDNVRNQGALLIEEIEQWPTKGSAVTDEKQPEKISTRKPNSPIERRVVWTARLAIAVLPVAIIATLVFHYHWASANESALAFQRSGAAIVALDAAFFGLVRWHLDSLNSISYWNGRPVWIEEKIFAALSLVFAIIGTLIWGYGDLLFFGLGE